MSAEVVTPPEEEERARGGGLLAFLGTLPGILAASAAVLTALSGFYVSSGQSAGPPPDLPALPGPPPVVDFDDAPSGLPPGTSGGLVDACAAGDLDACGQVLDTLVDQCAAGDGLSCDVLFAVTPVGSVEEELGATCGGRYSTWAWAGSCAAGGSA